MANPQKEHGYTPIANELLEAFAQININGEARQVLDAIIRKTYGYRKKSDLIALSQLEEATGLSRRNVCRAIKRLSDMKLITTEKKNKRTRYAFVKDWSTWRTKTGDKAVHNVWKKKKGSVETDTMPP